MYWTLRMYDGLFDDFGTEDGSFDPFEYVGPVLHQDLGEDEARLLMQGSGIKILCTILQAWGQGGFPDYPSPVAAKARAFANAGKLAHLGEIATAIEAALRSADEAWQLAPAIFQKFVAPVIGRPPQ